MTITERNFLKRQTKKIHINKWLQKMKWGYIVYPVRRNKIENQTRKCLSYFYIRLARICVPIEYSIYLLVVLWIWHWIDSRTDTLDKTIYMSPLFLSSYSKMINWKFISLHFRLMNINRISCNCIPIKKVSKNIIFMQNVNKIMKEFHYFKHNSMEKS